MTTSHDRLLELLTDRALVGLGQREQIELAELLVKAQDVDIAAFDRAVAAIALSRVGRTESMPESLAASIEERALAAFDGQSKRPASDYARTKQLDKLAPGLLSTQVDEIIEPDPASVEYDDHDRYKHTLTMEERPSQAAAAPASGPTLGRPNDPYVPKISTSPRPFAPAPSPPPPLALVPPPAAYPAAHSASHPSAPHATTHPSAPYALGPGQGPVSSPQSIARGSSGNATLIPFRAPTRGPSRVVAIGGWIAAAACLLLAIGAFALRGTTGPVATLPTAPPNAPSAPPTVTAAPLPVRVAQTPAELRAKLLAAEGTARAEWTPTKDPLGKAATGEVVWNKDQQQGVMRFKGLAKNDPSRAQYQLWIFDKNRDDKYPVDGGVFDVDSETGDVIVPIKATLAVNTPTLFAVTLEKPGGVVVSKRERIVVVAKLTAG